MDEIVERVENNFINIYKKFDILDKKLNNYHIKFDEINDMIDLIISNEYNKIYKTYYPMKNCDLVQDKFFIYSENIDIPLKANTYIIFEYIFEAEYIDIPLIVNLKIDNVLEKDFNINLKEYNKIRHMFKLDYNVTKITFYLYLFNNEIYSDEKMEYLKKYYLIIKKLNLIYFLIYKYMNYYRKPINKVINDVKLKMQLGALTLKISENNNKIDDLIGVDKNIKSDIALNLGKINTNINAIKLINKNSQDNSKDIAALKTSNIKAFYNLDKIFIYDIEKSDKFVDKNNYFHIFEKEIIYDFVRNSYLEIVLKLLTAVSNYVLIGYFQIVCNFYDQDNNLFYTISLSTAAGSINKLSTIKSVFIVPINEHMSKIKIDSFFTPIKGQEHRSAHFIIEDINSNKIYVKYYQKTDEMSIKDIQDSLININTKKDDIASNLININTNEDNIAYNLSEINYLKSNKTTQYLKNIYNILIYDSKTQIDFRKDIFYEKIFDVNSKQNDFIEMNFKIELEYQDIDDRNYVKTLYELFDENDNSLYIKSVNNNDYSYYSNKIFIDENIFYNFTKNVEKLKFVIKFQKLSSSRIIKIFYIKNDNYRFILKHYSS